MVARANVALADGETSPVTHTFTPNGDAANGILRYKNLNTSVPAASESLTISVRDSASTPADISTPGKKVSPRVVEMRLKDPVTYVDGVSGLTLIDFVNEAVITFMIHPRCSEQEAENIRKMCVDLLNVANSNQVGYAVDKGEHIW